MLVFFDISAGKCWFFFTVSLCVGISWARVVLLDSSRLLDASHRLELESFTRAFFRTFQNVGRTLTKAPPQADEAGEARGEFPPGVPLAV
jgi:hypothetical protein